MSGNILNELKQKMIATGSKVKSTLSPVGKRVKSVAKVTGTKLSSVGSKVKVAGKKIGSTAVKVGSNTKERLFSTNEELQPLRTALNKKVFWFTDETSGKHMFDHWPFGKGNYVENLTNVIGDDFYGPDFENAKNLYDFSGKFNNADLEKYINLNLLNKDANDIRESLSLLANGFNSKSMLGKMRDMELNQAATQKRLNTISGRKYIAPDTDNWASLALNEDYMSVDDFSAMLFLERVIANPILLNDVDWLNQDIPANYNPPKLGNKELKEFPNMAVIENFDNVLKTIAQHAKINIRTSDTLEAGEVTLTKRKIFSSLRGIKNYLKRVGNARSSGVTANYNMTVSSNNTQGEQIYMILKALSEVSVNRYLEMTEKALDKNAENLPSEEAFEADKQKLGRIAACLIASDLCYMFNLQKDDADILHETFMTEALLNFNNLSNENTYMPLIADYYAESINSFAQDFQVDLKQFAELKGVATDNLVNINSVIYARKVPQMTNILGEYTLNNETRNHSFIYDKINEQRRKAEELAQKQREERERKAREEKERQAREERNRAEQKAREERERKAREEEQRKQREREEAARKEKEERERQAQIEAEQRRMEEQRRQAEEIARKQREEQERKAREEAERKAKEEKERQALEEKQKAEQKAKAEQERKAKEEAERKAREEREAKENEKAKIAEQEEKKRILKEKQEEAERLRLQRIAENEKKKAEAQARREQKERERKEKEAKAKEERKQKEQERKARKIERRKERQKAREEEQRKAEELLKQQKEAEELALQAQKQRQAEAEQKLKQEQERKAREEAERKAKEERERQAQIEAEQRRMEEQRRQAEEIARKQREEQERKAREEAERKAKEEKERQAQIEAEQRRIEEQRRQAEEIARKQREEQERKAREEAERKAKEEAKTEVKIAPAYSKNPEYFEQPLTALNIKSNANLDNLKTLLSNIKDVDVVNSKHLHALKNNNDVLDVYKTSDYDIQIILHHPDSTTEYFINGGQSTEEEFNKYLWLCFYIENNTIITNKYKIDLKEDKNTRIMTSNGNFYTKNGKLCTENVYYMSSIEGESNIITNVRDVLFTNKEASLYAKYAIQNNQKFGFTLQQLAEVLANKQKPKVNESKNDSELVKEKIVLAEQQKNAIINAINERKEKQRKEQEFIEQQKQKLDKMKLEHNSSKDKSVINEQTATDKMNQEIDNLIVEGKQILEQTKDDEILEPVINVDELNKTLAENTLPRKRHVLPHEKGGKFYEYHQERLRRMREKEQQEKDAEQKQHVEELGTTNIQNTEIVDDNQEKEEVVYSKVGLPENYNGFVRGDKSKCPDSVLNACQDLVASIVGKNWVRQYAEGRDVIKQSNEAEGMERTILDDRAKELYAERELSANVKCIMDKTTGRVAKNQHTEFDDSTKYAVEHKVVEDLKKVAQSLANKVVEFRMANEDKLGQKFTTETFKKYLEAEGGKEVVMDNLDKNAVQIILNNGYFMMLGREDYVPQQSSNAKQSKNTTLDEFMK